MVVSATLKVVTLALLMTLCEGQSQDATKIPRSFGDGVVNTVISRIRSMCVYTEDRLFLRRTAYVMSRDGFDTFTYRAGFDGGIWQITQSMFLATRSCSQSSIRGACKNISSALGIDWTRVQWSDLRKPLYSGLAATLSALRTLGTAEMPGDVSSQARLWAMMYGQANGNTFIRASANTPIFKCKDKLDLAFILDSSGSVSFSDYGLMKNFTAEVVDALNVSLNAIRIADIIYSGSVLVAFDFDDHSTKSAVKSELLNARKIGGGTNTAAALGIAKTLFSSSRYGTRTNSKKVAVLITDGWSNSLTNTKRKAEELKNSGVTVFAIGVGNYNLGELKAVASDPICSHVLTLTGFDKIDSLINEIQKSACEANYQANPDHTITDTIGAAGSEKSITTQGPGPKKTIEATVSCGILHIFASLTDPKPSPAVFDKVYTAYPDKPAVLKLVETLPQGTAVYLTVLGIRLPPSAAALRKCSDYKWSIGSVTKKDVKVFCEENGIRRPCKDEDISGAGLCSKQTGNYPVDNPCTAQNLNNGVMRHSYPYDLFKFIECDKQGNAYIAQCFGGLAFNAKNRVCGFSTPGCGGLPGTNENDPGKSVSKNETKTVFPPQDSAPPQGIASKCSSDTLRKHQYYHRYDQDKTKFVQCDAWGTAYIKDCAPGTEWSQNAYACIHATSAGRRASQILTTILPATLTTPGNLTTAPTPTITSIPCNTHNKLSPVPCEPTKFYICDNYRLVLMPCPKGLVYNASKKHCDWAPPQGYVKPANCP